MQNYPQIIPFTFSYLELWPYKFKFHLLFFHRYRSAWASGRLPAHASSISNSRLKSTASFGKYIGSFWLNSKTSMAQTPLEQ